MADIFLSYNREDQAKAKIIAKALADQGFDVWWDTVLRAGQTYDEVTERQLHEAKAVVVLWSSRSVKSKWVRAEATLGDRKSALIPVMIEPCDRPIMFELIQTADLTAWSGDTSDPQWQAFVADVRDHVDRKRSAASPQPAPVPAAKVDAAAAAATDTIEAAFWMSIQDGEDPAELEAYLERYPQGHFAMLAKKRLAALTAVKASAPVAPPPEPAPKVEPAKVEPPRAPVQPVQASPRIDPFQQKQAAAPAAVRMKGKGGSPMPMIIGGVVAVAIAIAAFVFWPKGGDAGTQAASAETPAVAPEPVAPALEAKVDAAPVESAAEPPPAPKVEKVFRDCDACPQMMRLDGGAFMMGSPATEANHRAWEGPQREVKVPPIAVGIKEVTFAEWDACVADGGCNRYSPSDKTWGRGARPVIMVSWSDAQAYLKWLSGKTGKAYRLSTEAEWEFSARGGTTTAYWWGENYVSGHVPHGKTDETGVNDPNGFGLYDVTGNVAEWVQDCYVNTFAEAPTDGSAVDKRGCSQRVIRGGGWRADADGFRIANRSRLAPSTRDTAIGFRVVLSE
ncbi:MAG: SUMF1/EgtB/PvdO family nonheme iron enzyme [Hyphomonadaceae bacterium]